MTTKCAVIGNPIEHSLSPVIHDYFAKQCELTLDYQKIQGVDDLFEEQVFKFFEQGGVGLNVTLPFKNRAFNLCDKTTPVARRCGAVNTLWRDSLGCLKGDTTDGKGLINDLHFRGLNLQQSKVLILGAGGAARSIIPGFIEQQAQVSLVNRTLATAKDLIRHFEFQIDLAEPTAHQQYDIVINTMATQGEHWLQKLGIVDLAGSFIYDLGYGHRAVDFLSWCGRHGATDCSDGWGMLVEQAAMSFEIWHGIKPVTADLVRKPMY